MYEKEYNSIEYSLKSCKREIDLIWFASRVIGLLLTIQIVFTGIILHLDGPARIDQWLASRHQLEEVKRGNCFLTVMEITHHSKIQTKMSGMNNLTTHERIQFLSTWISYRASTTQLDLQSALLPDHRTVYRVRTAIECLPNPLITRATKTQILPKVFSSFIRNSHHKAMGLWETIWIVWTQRIWEAQVMVHWFKTKLTMVRTHIIINKWVNSQTSVFLYMRLLEWAVLMS